MGRSRRIWLPGHSVHVVQRGNNRMTVFSNATENATYLAMLRVVARAEQVAVHAYALMKTHVHLIVTPPDPESLPVMMKRLNVRYVGFFNRRHRRCGTIWNERYKPVLLRDERQWLTCLRYVEQNPVRAGIVKTADLYPWTSYRVHALGEPNDWLATHPVYEALGATPETRQMVYRRICGVALTDDELARQRFDKPQTLHRRPHGSHVAVSAIAGVGMV